MMQYRPNKGYILENKNYGSDIFRNDNTLNIFSDGAYTKVGRLETGGYAAVAAVREYILETVQRSWTSSASFSINQLELLAIREAISIGFKYRSQYQNINIFSDSQYAIDALRTYIYKWTFDPNTNAYRKSSYRGKGEYAKNIELIYEVSMNLINLMRLVPNVNLFFVKGHIDSYGSKVEIMDAAEKFKRINKISSKIDYNLIRYLSRHNDIADHYAKQACREADFNCKIHCPIQFIPQDINKYAQKMLVSNEGFTK